MRGFSLIELLISLFIITILTNIALPIYQQHIVHARRLQAIKTLLSVASKLENYYLLHNSYGGLQDLPISVPGYHLKFILHVHTYKLHANPIQQQKLGDRECGVLSINQHLEKKISGTGHISDCWG